MSLGEAAEMKYVRLFDAAARSIACNSGNERLHGPHVGEINTNRTGDAKSTSTFSPVGAVPINLPLRV
jgi:hypothetical protein